MKRILIFMALILIFTNIVVYSQGISPWAEGEVNQALEMGFVPEELQSNYAENTTREEFAKMAVSYLAFLYKTDIHNMVKIYCDTHIDGNGEKIVLAENVFTDCQSIEVLYAYTMGIVKGKGEFVFDPDGLITREEAAAMIMRTLFVYGGGLKHGPEIEEFEKYTDYHTISHWALSDVQYVWKLDIMKGVSETEFSPKTYYTREQSIISFLRLYNNYWGRPNI